MYLLILSEISLGEEQLWHEMKYCQVLTTMTLDDETNERHGTGSRFYLSVDGTISLRVTPVVESDLVVRFCFDFLLV